MKTHFRNRIWQGDFVGGVEEGARAVGALEHPRPEFCGAKGAELRQHLLHFDLLLDQHAAPGDGGRRLEESALAALALGRAVGAEARVLLHHAGEFAVKAGGDEALAAVGAVARPQDLRRLVVQREKVVHRVVQRGDLHARQLRVLRRVLGHAPQRSRCHRSTTLLTIPRSKR
jgi:hypothetical protein